MHKIACPHCDNLIQLPEQVLPKQEVYCPRCHSHIFEQHHFGTQRSLAYSVSALILLIIAISFPFLTLEAGGQVRTISLWEASLDLYIQGFWFLAILVLMFIIVVPLLYLSLLITLLLARKKMFSYRVAVRSAKALSYMTSWAMADVFIVGVLVSLIKVIEMADIFMGTSFWAYLAFAIIFVMITQVANRYQLWTWVEEINVRED
ncbi:MAG: paraquat-inducible protein A [Pseudomonadota bacterium]